MEIDYQSSLTQKLQELQACQKQQRVQSCFACHELIGCVLRKEYVKSVYESMNKGKGGGFEF
jgi:hypothetical protein